jgi:hypothetical protein
MTNVDIARLRALAAAEVPHINDVYDLREIDLPKLLDALEARDAEIARLRALVEAAFKEGQSSVSTMHGEIDFGFEQSDARKALHGDASALPPDETKGDAASSAEPGPERIDDLLAQLDATILNTQNKHVHHIMSDSERAAVVRSALRDTVRAWVRGE